MSKFIDYYAALGISPDATEEEIRKAYQKIAKTCHPDMTKGLPEEVRKQKEAEFILGTEGYKILKDKKKKESYDIEYRLHQAKQKQQEQQKTATEETPFWEQPNWGGYTNRNRQSKNNYDDQYEKSYDGQYEEDTDYYSMSDIMREILSDFINVYYDVKEQEYTLSERVKGYRKMFKHMNHPTILKKGFVIFGSELLYSAEKLKLKRKDDASHYIMRNRGKALVAAGLAVALVTGMFSETKDTTPVSDPITTETSDFLAKPVEPTITITRIYTVEAGDTLSGLAEEANCTRQEIKNINEMDSDLLYYKDVIKVPYHIPEDEIGRYTTVELYNGENLYDFAETYQTDPESLQKLNPDTIIEVNDSYAIISDTIVIPTFAPYDYNANKAK